MRLDEIEPDSADLLLRGRQTELGTCHLPILARRTVALDSEAKLRLARLAHEAALLGYFFQCLGYFGRCSLDSILVGERKEKVKIHWVECNGRWGGASIPMTLANRLLGDLTSAAFLVMEQADAVAEPWPFEEFCREMSPLLYKKCGPAVGIVILSPSRIEAGTGYELLVLGTSTDDVTARARAVEAAFQERQEPAPCHLISP